MPQNKINLGAKLIRNTFYTICTMMATLVLCISLYEYFIHRPFQQQQLQNNLQTIVYKIEQEIAIDNRLEPIPSDLISKLGLQNNRIISAKLVFNSGREQVLKTRESDLSGKSDEKIMAIMKNQKHIGSLKIIYKNQSFSEAIINRLPNLSFILIVICVFSVVLLWRLRRVLITPIKNLMIGLNEISGRYHNDKNTEKRSNELSQITQSFFELLNQLDRHQKELEKVNDDLAQRGLELEKQLNEHKLAEKKISFMTHHDALTGIPNREKFDSQLKAFLNNAHQEGQTHGLIYIDLDQFKVINDTCGHLAGDQLLIAITQIIQNELREEDFLARLGGDEFGILLPYCNLSVAVSIANKIRIAIHAFNFTWMKQSYSISASMGIVPISPEFDNHQALLSMADALCYTAKDKGRNCVELYQGKRQGYINRQIEMQWIAKINQALENNSIILMSQKIVPRTQSPFHHYEIVIRLKEGNNIFVPPAAFLPAAERYNLMPRIDRYVINRTFNWLQNNPIHLSQLELCSINISGDSLNDNYFLQFVINKLKEYHIPAHKICFEITESMAIKAFNRCIKFIDDLKVLGCKFALDDFGSGFSSYTYLKKLNVDFLKIDGSFVKDVATDPVDLAMVKSINEIGHTLNKKTIAEYVADENVKNLIAELDVDYFQGYHYGKPELLEN